MVHLKSISITKIGAIINCAQKCIDIKCTNINSSKCRKHICVEKNVIKTMKNIKKCANKYLVIAQYVTDIKQKWCKT